MARWRNGYAVRPARRSHPGSTPGWASIPSPDPRQAALRQATTAEMAVSVSRTSRTVMVS